VRVWKQKVRGYQVVEVTLDPCFPSKEVARRCPKHVNLIDLKQASLARDARWFPGPIYGAVIVWLGTKPNDQS
jgi:hypothetical protein